MPSPSSSKAEIVGLFLEAAIYGIYFALFTTCILIFYQRRKEERGVNAKFELATLLLFVTITLHLVVDVVRLLKAYDGPTVAQAALYYTEVTAPLSVVKTGVYVATTVVSDAFMLYRSYIIWNNSRAVLMVPILLFLADMGTGITATISLATLNPTQTFYIQRQTRITEAFFATTLALNGLCTVLIAFRIWMSQREMNSILKMESMKSMDSLSRVIVIVLESGAIYSTFLLLLLATYVAETTAAFKVFLDIISPIIGLVFSLIIVRVSLGFRPDGGAQGTKLSHVMFAGRSRTGGSHHNPGSIGMIFESAAPEKTVMGSSVGTMKSGTLYGSGIQLNQITTKEDHVASGDEIPV